MSNKSHQLAVFFTKNLLFISVFTVVFLTRIFGFIDISFALALSAFLINLPNKIDIPDPVRIFVSVLFGFTLYSLFITVIYGVDEIIWVMKFGRTCAMAFLLYYFFYSLNTHINYVQFQWMLILVVAFHSLLIYSMVANETIRNTVYSFTGFVPRGPAWSRSPGVTISYNATAIVHVSALFFLVRLDRALLKRLALAVIILPSLAFLGRSMAYIGLLMICLYLLKKAPIRSVIVIIAVVTLVTIALETDFEHNSQGYYYVNNLKHAVAPILSFGSDKGIENYFSSVLGHHIYFSQDWKVLLFGNSFSGHMALIGPLTGETDSDLGIINSINANGIIVTMFMYLLYLYFIYISRHGDWLAVAFIVILTLTLTFKETGFFTSHATPLLFLVVYFQLKQERISEQQFRNRQAV